jgi:hypothetical protein
MTALQKLIKQFEEIKDSNLESSIDVDFAISLAKSLLEKEKDEATEMLRASLLEQVNQLSDDEIITLYDNLSKFFKTKEK